MLYKFKPKTEFTKNVLTLITGTAIAQAIPIAMMPILTRLYTPEDFSLLAVFVAIFSILSVIVTGRYELAIMAPASNEEAKQVVFLSMIISCFFFFIMSLLVWFFNEKITAIIGNPDIGKLLYLLPVTVFFFGVYQSLNYWFNRKKRYKLMATNKLFQAGSISLFQVFLGIVINTGLVIGMVIGWVVSTIAIISKNNLRYSDFKIREIFRLSLKYKSYPLLQAPASLLNTVSSNTPVFFLARNFDSSQAGFFSVVIKILSAPAALIAKSIGQVFFQQVSDHAKSSPKLLLQDIYQVGVKLFLVSIICFTPIILWGDVLFSILLGEQWRVAGEYSQVLVIAVAVKFIVSPMSTIFLAVNKINVGSSWQAFYFITTMCVIFFSTGLSIELFIIIYTIHEVLLYLIYLSLMVYVSSEFS